MLVKKSTYNAVIGRLSRSQAELSYTVQSYNRLNAKWNALVERINALGGEDFLTTGESKQSSAFTTDELRSLIQLCHPDKHDGKPMATEMTAKLLRMKEALQ